MVIKIMKINVLSLLGFPFARCFCAYLSILRISRAPRNAPIII